MLVLKRRYGEKILVGDNIVFTVLRNLGGGSVSVGIDAPKDVRIIRTEIAEPREGTPNADNPK